MYKFDIDVVVFEVVILACALRVQFYQRGDRIHSRCGGDTRFTAVRCKLPQRYITHFVMIVRAEIGVLQVGIRAQG